MDREEKIVAIISIVVILIVFIMGFIAISKIVNRNYEVTTFDQKVVNCKIQINENSFEKCDDGYSHTNTIKYKIIEGE